MTWSHCLYLELTLCLNFPSKMSVLSGQTPVTYLEGNNSPKHHRSHWANYLPIRALGILSRHLEILIELNWFLSNSLSLSVGNSIFCWITLILDTCYAYLVFTTSEIFLFSLIILVDMSLNCSTSNKAPFLTMLGRFPFSYLSSDLRWLERQYGVLQKHGSQESKPPQRPIWINSKIRSAFSLPTSSFQLCIAEWMIFKNCKLDYASSLLNC